LVHNAHLNRSQALNQSEEADESQLRVEPIEENKDEDNSIIEKRPTVEERFKQNLKDRLNESKAGDTVAVSLVADKLEQTAKELGSSLGQVKANEFMNKILAASDSASNSEALSLTVESFFSEIASAATENPSLYQKLEEVKDTLKQATYKEGYKDDSLLAKKEADGVTTVLSAAQEKLYNSYVNARNITSQARYFFNNPSGNLVNSFA
jgi:hypothetical protein